MTPENKFGGSFGSNEWLVDEMYERYLADPNSVEANWQEFFSGYKPATNGASHGAASMQLLSRNAHLSAKTKLPTVGKSR